jgi:hypothetical protein
MKELLKRSASSDETVSRAALRQISVALELPLRQGIMSGDILGNIFESITLEHGTNPEFPLDFLSPGSEDLFVAYAVPAHGKLPEQQIESDYVTVPTYEVGQSMSWLNKWAKNARWDVVSRAMQVFEAGFVKKLNDDGKEFMDELFETFAQIVHATSDDYELVYDINHGLALARKKITYEIGLYYREYKVPLLLVVLLNSK